MKLNFNPTSIVVLLIALSGCAQPRPEGPPQIRYGQAECAHCGMIVSDDRYASAICVTIDREYRELVYDDIRCMYLNDRKEKLPADARRYVHDAETRAWLKVDEARFIRDPETQTPMGSGILAFAATSPRATNGVTYDQIDTLSKLKDKDAPASHTESESTTAQP